MIEVAGPPAVVRQADPCPRGRKADAVDCQTLLDGAVEYFAQVVGDIAEPDARLVEEHHPGAIGPERDRPQGATAVDDFLNLLERLIRNVPFGPVAILIPEHRPAPQRGKRGTVKGV